jgi:hypothetical protein
LLIWVTLVGTRCAPTIITGKSTKDYPLAPVYPNNPVAPHRSRQTTRTSQSTLPDLWVFPLYYIFQIDAQVGLDNPV